MSTTQRHQEKNPTGCAVGALSTSTVSIVTNFGLHADIRRNGQMTIFMSHDSELIPMDKVSMNRPLARKVIKITAQSTTVTRVFHGTNMMVQR